MKLISSMFTNLVSFLHLVSGEVESYGNETALVYTNIHFNFQLFHFQNSFINDCDDLRCYYRHPVVALTRIFFLNFIYLNLTPKNQLNTKFEKKNQHG